jgi:hypothetical protein
MWIEKGSSAASRLHACVGAFRCSACRRTEKSLTPVRHATPERETGEGSDQRGSHDHRGPFRCCVFAACVSGAQAAALPKAAAEGEKLWRQLALPVSPFVRRPLRRGQAGIGHTTRQRKQRRTTNMVREQNT